jgi:hypothetical protein
MEERRMLVNRLLSEIFDEEIAQFLEDGIYNKPNTLLCAAYNKFLEFPPVQRDKPRFVQTFDEVLGELPDLIHAYNKHVLLHLVLSVALSFRRAYRHA